MPASLGFHKGISGAAGLLLLFPFLFPAPAFPEPPEARGSLRDKTDKTDTAREPAPSYTVIPYGFYAPETQIGIGIGGGVFHRIEKGARPSSLLGQALYTQRKQFQVGLLADHYPLRAPGYFSLSGEFSKFPDQFYGIGDGRASKVEHFTATYAMADGIAQVGKEGQVQTGLQSAWRWQRMGEVEEGKLIARRKVLGAGSWWSLGAGPRMAWDTRNSVYYPTHGHFLEIGGLVFPPSLATAGAYGEATLNARHYFPMGKGKTLAALQAQWKSTWGAVPFTQLAQVGGGELLRGYYAGRYRDRHILALQAEYRFPLVLRLRGAAFAGGGKASGQTRDLAGETLLFSYGAGLRYRLNEEDVHFRLDFAQTRDADRALYITFLEAF